MAPFARIGTAGSDTYHLQPDARVPTQRHLYSLNSTLTARTSGQLFLYLNDAVWPPFLGHWFYGNNRGQAAVQVRLRPSAP